jgi:hypothetical protein
MNWLFSIHWMLVAAIWYFGSGVLHDIFVLMKHKGGYDRELLRLLMDGHVLILSGLLVFVCYMTMNKMPYGALINIIIAAGMLVYCAMIFPFLKSFGTIIISVILIIVSIKAMQSFPDSQNLMHK